MNKNNRLGCIKFRELNNQKGKSDEKQTRRNHLIITPDVLKLFTETCKTASKEINSNDEFEQENSSHNFFENNSESEHLQPKNNANEKKIYNVLIGKISSRKHKKWDNDGILEIVGKNADIDGKFIGKTIVKPETIEEGFRFHLGEKEIEIVELTLFNDFVQSRPTTILENNEIVEPPVKKTKRLNEIPVLSGSSLHFNYEPLIMPQMPLDAKCFQQNDEWKLHEVCVDPCLVSVLRPHQREGIVFLYKCIMGINNSDYKGAILADEMGLGKTLQCISLVWTLLKKGPYGKPVLKRVLIIAPSTLCENWNKEFKQWLGSIKITPYIVSNKNTIKNFTKIPRASIMIISYEMFVRNTGTVNNLNFELLICDEGHRLKNSEVKTLKLLNQLNCKRRILITGTPVQNDLQEFYTIANFVNPGIFGNYSEYKSYYEQIIVTSHYTTVEEKMLLGQERAKELFEKSKTFILRRTNNLINKYLPQKHEVVIFCRPTHEQICLYKLITDYWFNRTTMGRSTMSLNVIIALKKVCNHPCFFTNEKSNVLDEIMSSIPTNLFKTNTSFSYSSKMKIVQAIFEALKITEEKLVLVSYFTQTLDFLEKICYIEGLQFYRLDGSTALTSRTKIIEQFNSKDNYHRIFLLSAKAGGIGLNLIGASRLILFDSDWNPANDIQAMARIWRDGQKRSVYIYRLLTTGTIEEKIYQRQISKTRLSEAVIDANHIASVKISIDELKNLFSLDSKTLSVTHDLMECSCKGCGDIPYKIDKNSSLKYSRDFQFNFVTKKSEQQTTINHLLDWQHYKPPISFDLMKELMLQEVQEHISFIFKNTIKKLNNA
ncbi:PREDICTED: DNA repair and recombination protein RAD54B-like [Ceratosolen solmsi marchali]|uniref:DNA repair and recombination protein RAD54-like n=1 Tax=Ceratosolen solmsi marchali TaxID=326594 RepID=A0AAJ7DYK8_9HYME|nr:PREDICTED: DNA repair and recombination protein RAD54B-like [Ceratosolen solmsi marchali]